MALTAADVDRMQADRKEMLSSLDSAIERGKQLQRDKALDQIGVRLIGDMTEVEWAKVFRPSRERFIGTTPLVIHIGPQSGPSLCGVTRGHVAQDPSAVTLLVDRWCSRCWNKWAKLRAAE